MSPAQTQYILGSMETRCWLPLQILFRSLLRYSDLSSFNFLMVLTCGESPSPLVSEICFFDTFLEEDPEAESSVWLWAGLKWLWVEVSLESLSVGQSGTRIGLDLWSCPSSQGILQPGDWAELKLFLSYKQESETGCKFITWHF